MPMIPHKGKKPTKAKAKKSKGYPKGGMAYENGGPVMTSNARERQPYSTKGKAPTPGKYKGSVMYTKYDKGKK